MSPAAGCAVAVTFVWLGMVLAISFLEAPLKFRAPGVTLALGLGIGRLVFRALNAVEAVFAVLVVVSLLLARPGWTVSVSLVVAIVVLAGQVVLIRPRLTRRSDLVLAGGDSDQRSHAHGAYVVLEVIKALALGLGGVLLLFS